MTSERISIIRYILTDYINDEDYFFFEHRDNGTAKITFKQAVQSTVSWICDEEIIEEQLFSKEEIIKLEGKFEDFFWLNVGNNQFISTERIEQCFNVVITDFDI